MSTALNEFGIAGVSLRAFIDFLKTALQNSNAAVRTSATKALVTVKIFAGPSMIWCCLLVVIILIKHSILGVKDLIEDLSPQLLNTINAEFDKVDGQTPPEPTRKSADLENMVADSSKGSKGVVEDPLDELFPRVEIDGLLKGTTILADAKNDAWKVKKEALETLQGILDQGNNKRLKPSMGKHVYFFTKNSVLIFKSCPGEIGQVLKSRVTDTNKAVQVLALDIISRIATGMGKPFEKHARMFIQPICTVLADQKPNIRASAVQTLTAIATTCEGLETMITGITTAVDSSNPLQKATLFQWLVDWFKGNNPPTSLDIRAWAPGLVSSLDDRNADVRKAAQALLPTLIHCSGFDFVMQQTNSLKPASRGSAVPLIQAARPAISEPPKAVEVPKVSIATKPPATSTLSPSPTSPTIVTTQETKPLTKLSGVRRKLPQSLSRPDSRAENVETARPISTLAKRVATSTVSTNKQTPSGSPSPSLPFSNINLDLKKSRLAKDASRWINEAGPTRKDLADALQSQMEPHASPELVGRLFSHDHNAINDHIAGLTTIADFYTGAIGADENIEKLCLANLDFPLKYISMTAHEPQPNLISKCLDVTEAILNFLRNINYQLTDNEALCFVPTIVFKA